MPEERMKDMQQILYDADDIDFDAEDDHEEDVKAFAASREFRPLSEEKLIHMKTPSEEESKEKDVVEATPA